MRQISETIQSIVAEAASDHDDDDEVSTARKEISTARGVPLKSSLVANDSQEQQELKQPWKRRGRAVFSDLPGALERVTGQGLMKLNKILKLPLDAENGPLIRAQVTAAIGAINAQLRADEQRLRAKSTGDVLARLLKLVESERKLLSKQSPQQDSNLTKNEGNQSDPDGLDERG